MRQDTFSNRLIELMDARALTLRELSEACGISTSTLGNWRSGSIPTDFDAVRKMAIKLGVSFSFLMTGLEDVGRSQPEVIEVFEDGGALFDGYLEVKIKRLVPRSKKNKK